MGVEQLHIRHLADAEPGQAVDAVFLHSLMGDGRYGQRIASHMNGLNMVAIDMLGFGESPVPSLHETDYSLSAHAQVVAESLGNIALGKSVHVVGHSLGGAVALKLAAEHPEHVSGLTILGTAIFDGDNEDEIQAMREFAPLLSFMAENQKYGRLLHQALFSTPIARLAIRSPFVWRGYDPVLSDAINKHSYDSFRSSIEGYMGEGTITDLEVVLGLNIPVTHMHGNEDKWVTERAIKLLKLLTREHKNMRALVIDGAKHHLGQTHPEIVGLIIEEGSKRGHN